MSNEEKEGMSVNISTRNISSEKMNIENTYKNEKHKKLKKTNCLSSLFYFCFPCFKKIDLISQRTIYLPSYRYKNKTFWSNKEENNKYSILFFLPVVLINQFKQFGNFFYLIMTISQFIPELKVGFLFAYLSPLCMVVTVSILKELFDDINRRIQDYKTNSKKITILEISKKTKNINKKQKISSKLKIGDIIELKKDERVPADIIILKTFNESEENNAFIKTDQLDGETDWKLRKAPNLTQKMNENDILKNLEGEINYEPPSKLIYNFEGILKIINLNGENLKEAINLENTMWASTVLASQKIIGIVIYTGKETRARMNSSSPKIKIGILDKELNNTTIYLFFIMIISAIILKLLKGFYINMLFIFFKFIALFCTIIKIALIVNLVLLKSFFYYCK